MIWKDDWTKSRQEDAQELCAKLVGTMMNQLGM